MHIYLLFLRHSVIMYVHQHCFAFPLSSSFTFSLLQIKSHHVWNYKLSSLGYLYIGTVTPVSLSTLLMLSVTFVKTVSRMLQRKNSCVLGASFLTQGRDAVLP